MMDSRFETTIFSSRLNFRRFQMQVQKHKAIISKGVHPSSMSTNIIIIIIIINLWPESSSELYLPSDRRFSAKLMPTFTDRAVSRSQRGGSLTAVISVF
jgi:hypothetical protein